MLLKAILVALLLMPQIVVGSTWTVAKDGTGQYAEIQDAIDVAASGDTIMIGPGRYNEFQPYTYDMVVWDIIANADGKALVLLGTGDATIIGPDHVDNLEFSKSIGIYCRNTGYTNIIKNIIVENTYSGIMLLDDDAIIENITAQECWNGIRAASTAGCAIRNSVIRQCHDVGLMMTLAASSNEITECIFMNNLGGVHVDYNSTDVIIRECIFIDNRVLSIIYSTYSTGIIDNCQVSGSGTGIVIAIGAGVEIRDSIITPTTSWGLKVYNDSRIYGSGNIIHGAGIYPAILCCLSNVDMNESHILRDQGFAVKLDCVYPQGYPSPLDLSGNYWGTSSADSIAAWIWDGSDDPSMPVTVQYLPFHDTLVSNENKSFGEIKAMFRR